MNSIHGWNSSPSCNNGKDSFQKLCKLKRKLISLLSRPVFHKKVVLAGVAVNFPHFCIWAMPSSNMNSVIDWVSTLHQATWFCRWLVFYRCPVLISAGTTILTEVYHGFRPSLQPNPALVPSVTSPSLSPCPIKFCHPMLCSLTRWEDR